MIFFSSILFFNYRNPNSETLVIVSDLSGDARTVSQNIFQKVKHLDISTLIINAGFAVPEVFFSFFFVFFLQWPSQCSARPEPRNIDVLQTNVVTQQHLFSLIYPRICRRPKSPSGHTGSVIFISSANAELPVPLTQWYSATKAFLAQFARCLAPEAARLFFLAFICILSLPSIWCRCSYSSSRSDTDSIPEASSSITENGWFFLSFYPSIFCSDSK